MMMNNQESFCRACNVNYRENAVIHNASRQHINNINKTCRFPCTPIESALAHNINTFWLRNYKIKLINKFFDKIKPWFFDICHEQLRSSAFKSNSVLKCVYTKPHDTRLREEKSFKTKNTIITAATNLELTWADIIEKLVNEMTEFQTKGSRWTLQTILGLEVRVNRYNPLRASSYIALPQSIRKTRSVINVKNSESILF